MSKNYYHILGITSSATTAEIKAAYKRLAIRYHPDKNPENPHAEERFKQVNEAYQVLSDARRRAAFDLQQQYEQYRRQAHAYTEPRYHHTRQPAGFQERHYRQRPKKHTHFSRRDIQIVVGSVLLIVLLLVVINLGWSHFASGKAMERARAAEKQRQWEQAHEEYSTVLEHKPNLEEARIRRAELRLVYLKNPNGAIDDYTQAMEELEQAPANWYAARGKGYLQTKQYPQALRDLSTAIGLDATQAEAYLDRGILHLQLEDDWQAAEKDISTFLQKTSVSDRRTTEALLYRAFSYFRRHQLEEAWQDTEQALQHDPLNAQGYYLQAKIKQSQGNKVLSCLFLSKAAELGLALAREEAQHLCHPL